jgi:hypothetical protein
VSNTPLTDPPQLQISWARLPVLWWRDVPVTRSEMVEMNALDMFMIETTTRLGRLDASTFGELTGLSLLVFAALGRRLQTMEMLTWRDDYDAYVPARQAARALNDSVMTRYTTTTLDFLFLPHTDDLLVSEAGLADFERTALAVTGIAPLPTALRTTTRRELLTARITERKAAGLSSSVVGLAADDEPDEPVAAMAGATPEPAVPVCPAIDCSAVVEFTGKHGDVRRAELDVGERRRRRKSQSPTEPVRIDITGASGLIRSWRQIAELPGDPSHAAAAVQALASVPLAAELLREEGPGRWSLPVTGDQAAALAAGNLLTQPAGLEVRDYHAHVVTAVAFTPADSHAERLFALDALIQRFLAAPGKTTQIAETDAEMVRRVGGMAVVSRRAWDLGHRWIVHALRQREDFSYA